MGTFWTGMFWNGTWLVLIHPSLSAPVRCMFYSGLDQQLALDRLNKVPIFSAALLFPSKKEQPFEDLKGSWSSGSLPAKRQVVTDAPPTPPLDPTQTRCLACNASHSPPIHLAPCHRVVQGIMGPLGRAGVGLGATCWGELDKSWTSIPNWWARIHRDCSQRPGYSLDAACIRAGARTGACEWLIVKRFQWPQVKSPL